MITRIRSRAVTRLATETTLADARPGDRIEVLGIDDEYARIAALRFGMAEGAHLSCIVRVPAGPIVVGTSRQEIAVGRALARRIHVRIDGGRASQAG